jgi:hypothetical protein
VQGLERRGGGDDPAELAGEGDARLLVDAAVVLRLDLGVSGPRARLMITGAASLQCTAVIVKIGGQRAKCAAPAGPPRGLTVMQTRMRLKDIRLAPSRGRVCH